MKDLKTLVDELNQMILEGKILDAFEKILRTGSGDAGQ